MLKTRHCEERSEEAICVFDIARLLHPRASSSQ